MESQDIRLAGRSYSIPGMTPFTVQRVVAAMVTTAPKGIRDTPGCLFAMARGLSFAISGSGSFSRIKAGLLYRRFRKRASFDELIQAYATTLSLIPMGEIAGIASVMVRLSGLISKSHE